MDSYTARAEWDKLDGERASMLSRFERLAELTIPSVLPRCEYNTNQNQLTNGYSSLGAQAATHLINKLMMTMFAPSRPFMRLDMERLAKVRIMEQLGIEEDVLTQSLVSGEQAALRELEQAGERQILFEALTHLVCLGNGLIDMSGADLSFHGIRNFVVRRSRRGKIACLILREKFRLDELEDDAAQEYRRAFPGCKWDDEVCVYTWVRLVKGTYRSSVWVEDVELSIEHSGKWTPENLPWRVLTWRLPYGQNYGVGRAEDYANDLAEHEILSRAVSEGSALASTFKWLQSPTGLTRAEDVTNSENGAVIPGSKGDVDLLYANIGQQLSTVLTIKQDVARRIGQGFLLNSAVTRDAERVTAEEIRLQAMELESSLGGTYSRLSLEIQKPLAHWLLKRAKVNIQGTDISPVVITGLDALSRNSDRERMLAFLNDVAALDGLQPNTRQRLREGNIITDMAAGNGVDRARYVASEAEVARAQAAEQQQALDQQAGMTAMEVAAQQQVNGASA